MRDDDAMACVKMLKARGGALDLKAAEIIEGSIANLDERTKRLEEAIRKQIKSQGVAMFATKRPADKDVAGDVRAVLADALEPVIGPPKDEPWAAVDLAHIMISEYRGALLELDEIHARLHAVTDASHITPLLAAVAAVEEIKSLRAELAEYRIADEAARDELVATVTGTAGALRSWKDVIAHPGNDLIDHPFYRDVSTGTSSATSDSFIVFTHGSGPLHCCTTADGVVTFEPVNEWIGEPEEGTGG
jgi:hypothetical protein